MTHRWFRTAILLLVGCLLPLSAQAGRRPFLWVYDTEVVPERGVELETWVTDFVRRTPTDSRVLWWAPVLGVTDRLELALPVEIGWTQAKDVTQLLDYGVDLRYRLANPDRVESGPIVPLLRLGAYRLARGPEVLRLEGDLVLAVDLGSRVHLALNGGGRYGVRGEHWTTAYGAGLAFAATDELKLGAEFFAMAPYETPGAKPFSTLGPTVGWTHGRMWITAGVLAGLTEDSVRWMSRLLWAVAW